MNIVANRSIATLRRDQGFFCQAAEIASYSDYSTRVGCVAAKGNKLIAGAFNTVRNSAANVPYGEATSHAECNVLNMLTGTGKITLYIARLNKVGDTMPSRPCIKCMREISFYRIDEIVYQDKFNKIVKEKL